MHHISQNSKAERQSWGDVFEIDISKAYYRVKWVIQLYLKNQLNWVTYLEYKLARGVLVFCIYFLQMIV